MSAALQNKLTSIENTTCLMEREEIQTVTFGSPVTTELQSEIYVLVSFKVTQDGPLVSPLTDCDHVRLRPPASDAI